MLVCWWLDELAQPTGWAEFILPGEENGDWKQDARCWFAGGWILDAGLLDELAQPTGWAEFILPR